MMMGSQTLKIIAFTVALSSAINFAVLGLVMARPDLLAHLRPAEAEGQRTATPADAPTPGRFVLAFSPHAAQDTFLLDTATGRVWSQVKFTDLNDEPLAWEYMDRLDNAVDEGNFAARIGRKPEPNPPVKR